MIVALRDCLTWPMPVDRADLKLLVVPPELHEDLQETNGYGKNAVPGTQ